MEAPRPTTPTSSTPDASRDVNRETFRQLLRQADKFILEQQFEKAREQLAEARNLFPQNPFIIAFEERISIFENKSKASESQQVVPATVSEEKPHEEHAPEPAVAGDVHKIEEALERKIRQEIEAEYTARLAEELQNAESISARVFREEREKFEQQQQALKEEYDRHLKEALETAQKNYASDLEREILNAEQNLKNQHAEHVASVENAMKSELMKQYEEDLKKREGQFEREKEILLEHERKTFESREKDLKDNFANELREALQKTEQVARAQTIEQQQSEKDHLREQLTGEFQKTLERERNSAKKLYEQLKASIETTYREKEESLRTHFEKQLGEQLQQLQTKAAEEFEVKRANQRKALETEFDEKLKTQLEEERQRIQSEAQATIDAEKKSLNQKYEEFLKEQEDKIEKIRTDLSNEKEKVFLQKLTQVAHEYENKLELLGATVPESPDERKAMYREKIRPFYVDGMPTVEAAKRVMQLKELLGLTFDDHLQIESDVRLNLYVENVEKKLKTSGGLNEADVLEELKKRFSISQEEIARLEPYILSRFQKATSKGRILVVDDEVLLLETVSDLLAEHGFQVTTAADVKSAIDALAKTAFDLILSDINFGAGELDGFKFFNRIQDDDRLRKIPFVFMTSLKDGVIVRSGLQMGADDYLTKPVDPDILVAVIEGKLKRFGKAQ